MHTRMLLQHLRLHGTVGRAHGPSSSCFLHAIPVWTGANLSMPSQARGKYTSSGIGGFRADATGLSGCMRFAGKLEYHGRLCKFVTGAARQRNLHAFKTKLRVTLSLTSAMSPSQCSAIGTERLSSHLQDCGKCRSYHPSTGMS